MSEPQPTSQADALRTALDARYSCRGFKAEPVPRDTISTILTMAQRTPSWCNAQPWQVVIITGAKLADVRERFIAYVGAHAATPDFPWPLAYNGVYGERRRACGFQLYEAVGIARGDKTAAERQRLENFRFFGAPHVAIVTSDTALGVYGALDCGAYVNTFTLAARALGVASIAQAALAAFPDFWRAELGLAAERRLVCGISFGFEDASHPANRFRTGRAAISDAVRFIE